MATITKEKGGNGDVFLDAESGTAKKKLRNTGKEKIERFKRELAVLREISPEEIPNIVEVREVYIDENKVTDSYILMKKYDGSLYNLFPVTKGNVKLTLRLILPIIKALKALAERPTPIYHRDIKPDNILYLEKSGEYELYLADFGACFLKDDDQRITPEDIAVGPRMFIAPEYERGRVEDVTEKGDIFSLGKVIWCMINGEENELLPSNFWFVDDYNLTTHFPGDPDMIGANVIIASCLNINPSDRCTYTMLIEQIEAFLNSNLTVEQAEKQYKVSQYQEKRKLELAEIYQKNKMLVNSFSIYFVNALQTLKETYPDFDLVSKLYEDYRRKSTNGVDYTTANFEKNNSYSLHAEPYDRAYISIIYHAARGEERYSHITFDFRIDKSNTIKIFFTPEGTIVYERDKQIRPLNQTTMEEFLDDMVMKYIG